MIRKALIAIALLGAAPAVAGPNPARDSAEVRIPRMGSFLDWRPDGISGLYIRADTGSWYYARLQTECPRLAHRSNIRFEAAPNGDLDRYGAVRAEGWRCQIASITRSGPPPNYRP
jgi:hypothetical protein